MELLLERDPPGEKHLLGSLSVNGSFECFTLESRAKAIPAGRFRVRLTWSRRFRKIVPLVDGVPGRAGIRIHSANDGPELEGCIAPGRKKGQLDADPDLEVLESRLAYDALFPRLKRVEDVGEQIWITIRDAVPSL